VSDQQQLLWTDLAEACDTTRAAISAGDLDAAEQHALLVAEALQGLAQVGEPTPSGDEAADAALLSLMTRAQNCHRALVAVVVEARDERGRSLDQTGRIRKALGAYGPQPLAATPRFLDKRR
jgi:hypothetical protein